MKKKTLIKIILLLIVFNTFLSFFNAITNFFQQKDIEFNERLFDVFIENEAF